MKPDSQDPEKDQEIFQILKGFASLKAEYPAELLAARRAAFIDQVVQSSQVEVTEELISKDQEIIRLLSSFRSVEAEYPSKLLTARRTAFVRQAAQVGRISLWEALRSAIQNRFADLVKTAPIPSMKWMRTSFIVAGLALVAFMGFLLYGNRVQLSNLSPSQNEISQPGLIILTTTSEVRIICKPGYLPPLCLAKEFDNSRDLTYQGNGSARPAVAKDTIPGYGEIHRAANVNDGMYGPGASWISNSADSWIKIDLGKATSINTVAFGRDRLGKYNDRDPGQFVIAVALSDDIYADGNSRNDKLEYTQVYDSEQAGFDGIVSGAETVQAQFGSLVARFIKITFENAGTAIDEVEVFMMQPAVLIYDPTKKPEGEPSLKTSTPLPTSSPLPTNTLTLIPTNTPTATLTPIPTDTPLPTDTFTPIPTDTPVPTDTPTPEPTNTLQPTDTPIPLPSDTLEPNFELTERPIPRGGH
jgi:hypothetical protein